MKRITLLLLLIALIVVANQAWAMSSTNYRLDWFTPLTSSGGSASSANYAVDFSVGQTATGYATSSGYQLGLGYWYGAGGAYQVFLPLMMK